MIFFKRRKLNRLLKKLQLLSDARLSGTVSDSAISREAKVLMKVGGIYDSLFKAKQFPMSKERALECYRLSANLGNAQAAQIVGERFLEQGKFWISLKDTIYYDPEVHDVYAERAFHEAYSYLNTADKLGDIIGKRLLGVLYVNGWGIEADLDKGIELVMESLNMANEWNRSAVILSELGLTNPEFFKKLTAHGGGAKG